MSYVIVSTQVEADALRAIVEKQMGPFPRPTRRLDGGPGVGLTTAYSPVPHKHPTLTQWAVCVDECDKVLTDNLSIAEKTTLTTALAGAVAKLPDGWAASTAPK